MNEVLIASPISGLRERTVTVQDVTWLGGGGEEKYKVTATMEYGSRKREVFLVDRREQTDLYVENWQGFRAAGLPVVPTLRKSSFNSLWVTDVTVNRSYPYGKNVWGTVKDEYNVVDKDRPLDSVFIEVTADNNFPAIDTAVANYTEIANQADIFLPYDDPFEVLIHPSGTWQLIMLDIHNGMLNNEFYPNRVVRKKNGEYVANFLEQLHDLHDIFVAAQKDSYEGIQVVEAIRQRNLLRYFESL